MKIPIDSLFHGKISDFMKIHEILKKHPERDSITVENLIISSNFSKISKNEQFSLENHWSVQDLTGKTSFW